MGAILITGASSGIGREFALQLAAPDKTLVLLGQNSKRLEETCEQVRQAGSTVISHACDLANFDRVEAWFRAEQEKGLIISDLYLNAARNTFGLVHETPLEDQEWVYRVNILSPLQWISLCYPDMEKRGEGRIVLMSSLAAYSGLALAAPYTASKEALFTLHRSLEEELRATGVNIHVICPGFVKTRIFGATRYSGCAKSKINNTINTFRFPFLSAKQAAAKSLAKIGQGKTRIVFPRHAQVIAFSGRRLFALPQLVHDKFIRLVSNPASRTKPQPLMTFKNKVCVVTGAASGIGKQLVTQLIGAGATVHAIDISPDQTTYGAASITHHQVDVSDKNQMQAVADKIHANGPIDLLINNAGVTLVKKTAEITFAEHRRLMDINYFGMLNGISAFYPKMVECGHGHIANVASVAGNAGYASSASYAASKAAILGFTRMLRLEAKYYGVHIHSVLPSYVQTEIFHTAEAKGWSPPGMGSDCLTRPISPEQAAHHLLSGILKGKKRIVFPFSGKLLDIISSWAPPLLAPLQRQLLKTMHIAYQRKKD